MEKKVAVITGASSGIDGAIADKLIKNDFQLVLTGRSISKNIEKYPVDSCTVLPADLVEQETPGRLLQLALEKYGKCDYLFANAGIIEPDYICIPRYMILPKGHRI